MAQHDGVIDNGPGLAVRTDINAVIQALMTQNSGPVEPTVKYPGQLWLDTTVAPDGQLRMRNQANSGWVTPTVQPSTAGNIVLTVLVTSGTWTKPAGLRFLEVYCVGGGGGGTTGAATAASQASAGGGGGGSGTVYQLYKAADLSATEAYVVGAAGTTAAGVGNAGGNSTFKGLTAGGGGGGGAIVAATGTIGAGSSQGAGGTATGGQINIPGSRGAAGMSNAHGRLGLAIGGDGGSTLFAAQQITSPTATTLAGIVGNFPGGGGTGGANGPSQASSGGALGGAGAIIIKEIF